MPRAGPRESGGVSLVARLEHSVSRRAFMALACAGGVAEKMGSRAYLVGGVVRDAILGCPGTDLDVMVEGDAEALARAFARSVGGKFKRPTEFATCKVETPGLDTIDFATSRRETYGHPGALPKVVASGIADDLWRRDFTINAMAVCLNLGQFGKLVDPCGGLPDLKRGRLRVMHEASFTDDPTRILRGIRFAARFGLCFESNTLKLLRASIGAGCLKTVSGKRIYRELTLICAEPEASKGVRLLERHGTLDALGFRARASLRRRDIWRRLPKAFECLEGLPGGDLGDHWLSWFASLFAGLSDETARRLAAHFNLPREVRQPSLWTAARLGPVSKRLAPYDSKDAYKIRLMLDQVPQLCLVHLYAVSAPRARGLMVKYVSQWRHVRPALTGGQIAELGLGEGPQVGRMLEKILRLRLAGRIRTRNDEVALVRRETERAKNAAAHRAR